MSAPVRGPSLKQLLRADEAAGSMRVDEQNGRGIIRLLSESGDISVVQTEW